MPNLGMGELIILLLIVLLVFGASRLPQVGEGLGKAIKGLKRGLQSDDDIEVESRKEIASTSSAQSAEIVEDVQKEAAEVSSKSEL